MQNLDAKRLTELLVPELKSQPKGSGRTGLPVAWASTYGKVRTENQDRIVVAHGRNGLSVAVLADGMGGMKEGAHAAMVAASAAVAYCIASPMTTLEKLLTSALTFANDEVFRILRGDGGAALVLAAWTPDDRYVAHAGDARAYHIKEDGHLHQITLDDTVKAQLQNLRRPSAEESHIHSQLLQFIGIGKDLEPHVTRIPDGGRGLILTSDGVHCLPLSVMEWVVKRAKCLQVVVERLVTASEWNGGEDNGTVVATSLQNGHPATQDLAEFWSPGNRLVVPDGTASQLAEGPRPPKDGKSQSRQFLGQKKQPRKRGPTNAKPNPPREHTLPIVAFGEAPSDENSDLPAPQPASATENDEGQPLVASPVSDKQSNGR